MKKLFVLFVSILLNTSFLAVFAIGQEKETYMTRTFPASSIKTVETNTLGGSVAITGNAGSKAVVEVYISHEGWSAERAKQIFEANYKLDIKVENEKLYVEVNPKENMKGGKENTVDISIKISAPKQATTNLKTVGGSISLRDLSGTQNFNTVGGSLTITNVSGNIDGATTGGSINVTNSGNSIDLKTTGGSIVVADCNGNITLSNVGGNTVANGIKGTLKINSMAGSVKLYDISGSVEAGAFNGAMDVKMTSVSDFVKLSSAGNISLSLPAGKGYNLYAKGKEVETTGLKDFQGTKESDKIEGIVGKGGPEISITSSMESESVDKDGNKVNVKTAPEVIRLSFE